MGLKPLNACVPCRFSRPAKQERKVVLPFGRIGRLGIRMPSTLLGHPNMMTRAKFSDLPPGTRFKFDGRVYFKLRMNLAKNDHHEHTVFPTEMPVEPCKGCGKPLGGEERGR